jgi:hypothetical protein
MRSLHASGRGSSRGLSPDVCGSLVVLYVQRVIRLCIDIWCKGLFPLFFFLI